jgi:FtsH-binding integral membrane protein
MTQMPSPFTPRGVPLDYAGSRSSIASFMNQVYAWMCVGLAVTAAVAWMVANNARAVATIFQPGTYFILILAELGLVMAISYAVNKISTAVATLLFLLYAALNGLTLSVILLVYAPQSVAISFITTAAMFGAMSLVGYFTKKDLTSLGGFLIMALIGLIIASLVNMFVASSALTWLISYAGVFIFLGLTAYDTQKIKEIGYLTQGDDRMAGRMAIRGSLVLYLDFINLLLFVLRILGNRRN